MRSQRFLASAAAALVVVSLGLAGCGGSSSGGGSSSAAVDTEKQTLVDELMKELENDGSITDEQKNCLRDQFGGFTVDELKTMKNSADGSDVPQELQDKVVNAVLSCVGGESASPSEAAPSAS